MAFRPRALLLLGLLAVAACGRDKVEPTDGAGTKGSTSAGGGGGAAAAPGATFVYARGKDSPGLDPAEVTDGESSLVLVNVYDTLVRFKYGSADVEPALATSWTSAPDRLSLTFALRRGRLLPRRHPAGRRRRRRELRAPARREAPVPLRPRPLPVLGRHVRLREARLRARREDRPLRVLRADAAVLPLPARDVQLLHRLAEGAREGQGLRRAQPRRHRRVPVRVVGDRGDHPRGEPRRGGGARRSSASSSSSWSPTCARRSCGSRPARWTASTTSPRRDVARIRKDARFRLHQVEGGPLDLLPRDEQRREAVRRRPRASRRRHGHRQAPARRTPPTRASPSRSRRWSRRASPATRALKDRPRDVAGAKAAPRRGGRLGREGHAALPEQPAALPPRPERDGGLDPRRPARHRPRRRAQEGGVVGLPARCCRTASTSWASSAGRPTSPTPTTTSTSSSRRTGP